MNAFNPFRFTSHQKNWEKCLLFNLFNFWMLKLTKTSILPNCQVPNSFFGITVNFIIQKLMFCKIEKESTLIKLLSAWDRSRDSTAKKTCQRTCRGPFCLHWVSVVRDCRQAFALIVKLHTNCPTYLPTTLSSFSINHL